MPENTPKPDKIVLLRPKTYERLVNHKQFLQDGKITGYTGLYNNFVDIDDVIDYLLYRVNA